MNFPKKYVNHSNVCIYYPATIFKASKRVTDLSSAKPKLLPEPNLSSRKSVFWKLVNFPSHFFPQWKWYFRSNNDWKFSFLIPEGMSGTKSTILRLLREYSQILQLVPRILKCTLKQVSMHERQTPAGMYSLPYQGQTFFFQKNKSKNENIQKQEKQLDMSGPPVFEWVNEWVNEWMSEWVTKAVLGQPCVSSKYYNQQYV